MADETTQAQQETTEGVGKNTAATTEANDAPAADTSGEKAGKPDTLTLTQEALDRIIDERLNRQRAQLQKRQDEERQKAEALRLAEQGEFKTLADQRAARIAELESELATRDVDLLRSRLITETEVGGVRLKPELAAFVTASAEADIKAQIQTLIRNMAPPKAPATEGGPARPVGNGHTVEQAAGELRRRYGSL